MRTPYPAVPRTALLAVAIGLVAATAPPARSAENEAPVTRFLDALADHFDRHPEQQNQRGTGWNPYQRVLWFETPLIEDGSVPTGAQRWAVLDEKRRRAGVTSRSPWFELGPTNLSGRILDIEFVGGDQIVYVGSASGGLWKTTDGGDTWLPLTDELPSLGIGGVAVSPGDPDVVLIGTGEGTPNFGRVGGVGILKSTDAGNTWAVTGFSRAQSSGHGFHFVEANPSTGTFLAGAIDGLYRSTDVGETWTEVGGGGAWYDGLFKPASTRAYAFGGGTDFGGGNTAHLSTDDGATWTASGTGLPPTSTNGKSKLALSDAVPTLVYAHVTYGFSTYGVYRSTNEGLTWTPRNESLNIAAGQGWYNLSLAVDPNDVNNVIAGGVELWRSTDGGTTFAETGDGYGLGTDTAVHWDHHALDWVPGANSTLWCGSDGGVWRSTDDGSTWNSRREGINTYQFYDICVAQSDPDWLMGGTQDNGVPGPATEDTWFTSNLFADGMVCNVDPEDATTIYAEYQFGNQVKSTDSGASWEEIPAAASGPWVTAQAIDRHDPQRLWIGTGGGIYRTTNGGASWTGVVGFNAIWIDASLLDSDVVWAVNATTARVSTNGGTTWGLVGSYGFPVGSETKIAADPGDVDGAFITFASYDDFRALVAHTTDRGASWTDVTGDLPAQPVNTMVVDPQFPDEWYIGTDTGVWRSTDGGATWLPFDAGLPNSPVLDLEIRDDARKIVAGTHGRGAWEGSLSGSPSTDVQVAAGPANADLMLDPPSPNPVRMGTTLRFAARHDGPVRLSIHDVAGRRVTPVVELPRGDGLVRQAPWSARDVPSGVYFAVLEAGDARVSRKIIVLR